MGSRGGVIPSRPAAFARAHAHTHQIGPSATCPPLCCPEMSLLAAPQPLQPPYKYVIMYAGVPPALCCCRICRGKQKCTGLATVD